MTFSKRCVSFFCFCFNTLKLHGLLSGVSTASIWQSQRNVVLERQILGRLVRLCVMCIHIFVFEFAVQVNDLEGPTDSRQFYEP